MLIEQPNMEYIDDLKYIPYGYELPFEMNNSNIIIGEIIKYKLELPEYEREIRYIHTYKEVKIINNENVLFIGDSRFVGMKQTDNNNYKFFCEIGKGYNWFVSNKNDIDKLVDNETIVVVSLGVNDLYNVSNYENLFNKINYKNMYFVSINPVDEMIEEQNGYDIKNDEIDKFNNHMKIIFKDKFIDTNTFLNKNGFKTRDGIHYDANTYKKIYSYITNFIADDLK